jgi:hypothetical protein
MVNEISTDFFKSMNDFHLVIMYVHQDKIFNLILALCLS